MVLGRSGAEGSGSASSASTNFTTKFLDPPTRSTNLQASQRGRDRDRALEKPRVMQGARTSGCAAGHGPPREAAVAEDHVHLHASVTAQSVQILTENLHRITTRTATRRTDTERAPFPPRSISPRTSTVGLPRLSKICLAFTDAIVTAISSRRDEALSSLSQKGKCPLARSLSL